MESSKLLHSCRSNVCLYSQDSRPVWCPGWIPWEGYLHWVHLFSLQIMGGQPKTPCTPGRESQGRICIQEHRQHSHSGSNVSPTPSTTWQWQESLPQNASPHRSALPLLSTHSASWFPLRKLSFAFQAQGRQFKVCKRYLGYGLGSTARTSRQTVSPFDLDLLLTLWLPGLFCIYLQSTNSLATL